MTPLMLIKFEFASRHIYGDLGGVVFMKKNELRKYLKGQFNEISWLQLLIKSRILVLIGMPKSDFQFVEYSWSYFVFEIAKIYSRLYIDTGESKV
jgi:hypothetical protein